MGIWERRACELVEHKKVGEGLRMMGKGCHGEVGGGYIRRWTIL